MPLWGRCHVPPHNAFLVSNYNILAVTAVHKCLEFVIDWLLTPTNQHWIQRLPGGWYISLGSNQNILVEYACHSQVRIELN